MNEYRVMATGHRPRSLGGYAPCPWHALVRAWLRAQLERVVAAHPSVPVVAISGGALGVDQWFAEEAYALGLAFDLYEPFSGFEARWPAAARLRYAELRARARRVLHVCAGDFAPWKMQRRNERMVDDAQEHLAVWNGLPGGTANCVWYMRECGLEPVRLDPRSLL